MEKYEQNKLILLRAGNGVKKIQTASTSVSGQMEGAISLALSLLYNLTPVLFIYNLTPVLFQATESAQKQRCRVADISH